MPGPPRRSVMDSVALVPSLINLQSYLFLYHMTCMIDPIAQLCDI